MRSRAAHTSGTQKYPTGGQQLSRRKRQGNDDVGHDIGQHHIVPLPGHLRPQRHIGEHVAGPDRITVPPDAVHGRILIGYTHRFGIDVHAYGLPAAQQQGRDGQDSAATAQVQSTLPLPGKLPHSRHSRVEA